MMKIAILTIGRFHCFDMASQLEANNVLGGVFTGYPRFKLKNEDVPPEKIHSIWQARTLAMVLARPPLRGLTRPIQARLNDKARDDIDRYAERHLGDCNGLISLSVGLASGVAMKRRGGFWVCDRGSAHVLFQDQILREEAEIVGVTPRPISSRNLERQLFEYANSDAIFIPSLFAERTFLQLGVPAKKVKLAPYGVNTVAFSPGEAKTEKFTVLYAGQISYQKGFHYLLKAWRQWAPKGAELRVAGMAPDETMPALVSWAGGMPDGVTLLGHLNRTDLAREMSRAHALVLPSVQDGFGLVMAQAMACGTPVIATHNTGAETLYRNGVEGLIGPIRSPEFLIEALDRLASDSDLAHTMGQAALERARTFGGTEAYGRRIMALLREIASGQ
jgi:glycosyltransferase involved in cell wall biosynthesis